MTYSVIYADPAWAFRVWSKATGHGRSAASHYKTTETVDMAKLPIAKLAARDSTLLMWATNTHLEEAFALGRAWGFVYKTVGFTWVKLSRAAPDNALALAKRGTWHFGMGYWTRANPELCLLFTRGKPKRLNADVPNLVVARAREHSRKPDEMYGLIERLLPGPYVELFARRPHDGWDIWGNEVESTATVTNVLGLPERIAR